MSGLLDKAKTASPSEAKTEKVEPKAKGKRDRTLGNFT